MLTSTFCHIPGIGLRTEQQLWDLEIHSWEDLGGFENVRNRLFIQVQSFSAGAYPMNAAPGVVSTREELGARGRADGADIKTIEHRAGLSQCVDSRRGEIRVAVNPKIAPTLIICEYDQDIRLARSCGFGSQARQCTQNQAEKA